ncbi:MAG TPA: ATP-dependent helicase, partial [Galbitalea sp.]
MPPYKKSAPARATPTSGARKPGTKAPGHRGYRPAEGEAPKKRWTTSDREQRAAGTGRPATGRPSRTSGTASTGGYRGRDDKPQTNDRRPDWTPREKPAYQPRGERPAYGDRPSRTSGTDYNDRGSRTERPAYGDRPQRSDRPAYNDRPARTERPAYGDRPSYNDRPARTDRPSYNDRPARTDRPSYNDRPARTD